MREDIKVRSQVNRNFADSMHKLLLHLQKYPSWFEVKDAADKLQKIDDDRATDMAASSVVVNDLPPTTFYTNKEDAKNFILLLMDLYNITDFMVYANTKLKYGPFSPCKMFQMVHSKEKQAQPFNQAESHQERKLGLLKIDGVIGGDVIYESGIKWLLAVTDKKELVMRYPHHNWNDIKFDHRIYSEYMKKEMHVCYKIHDCTIESIEFRNHAGVKIMIKFIDTEDTDHTIWMMMSHSALQNYMMKHGLLELKTSTS